MKNLIRHCQLGLVIAFISCVCACSSPSGKFFKYANSFNLTSTRLNASGFQLQTFANQIDSEQLNIYLDGDGSPWLKGRHPAFDPTPRNLLTLQLMQQDTHSAIYIGRPCYFELGPVSRCSKQQWTQGRYGEDIVGAIDAAISQTLKQYRPKRVRLIGFSGGGALAVLIASRRDDINSVITVAGNLDTDLWTRQHGYLPLIGSLNPALSPSLTIPSLHLPGGRDNAVPSNITRSYLKNHSGDVWAFPDVDHHCCWLDAWPQILQQLPQRLNTVQLPTSH